MRTPGDTPRGLLRVPRFLTDEGLKFRPTAEASTQKIEARTLRAFGLQDGRRFVRRNAENGIVDSAAVLLQQLVVGYVGFYCYDMDIARHHGAAEYTQSETVQYCLESSSRRKLTAVR